ncbi:MAG: biotin/lipoyl-binding protein [Eubacterium sp.]|nr:biotin/lipoyl-binding protein [Eubacterium sp.]
MFRAIKKLKAVSALTAAALLLSLTGCAPSVEDEIVKPINGETKLSYKTAKAEYMTIETEEKVPAEIGFATYTSFSAPFDTKVKKVNVTHNGTVKAGDVLLELDTSALDFQINEQQIVVAQTSDSIKKEAAQIELDKLLDLRESANIIAPYDGIVNELPLFQEGSDLKEGDKICTVSVPESIYVYNAGGAGKNLRFGMDVKLVINNKEYAGTITAAPDTIPSDASKNMQNYSAATLNEEDLQRLLSESNGATQAAAGWATMYAITVKRINVLAVPESAIKVEGVKYYCSILSGDEKYDMPVEVGVTAGGYTEILSGINQGDVVILSEKSSNKNNNNNNDREEWDGNWDGNREG